LKIVAIPGSSATSAIRVPKSWQAQPLNII
jgi:hypothetical protein